MINLKELMTTKRLTKAQKAELALAYSTTEAVVEANEVLEAPVEEVSVDLGQAMTNLVTVKTMKKVKTVKTGVGSQILFLIAQGHLSNKEIVAKVLEDNPIRKTTYACVTWYQSQVKAGKIDLPVVEEETEDMIKE